MGVRMQWRPPLPFRPPSQVWTALYPALPCPQTPPSSPILLPTSWCWQILLRTTSSADLRIAMKNLLLVSGNSIYEEYLSGFLDVQSFLCGHNAEEHNGPLKWILELEVTPGYHSLKPLSANTRKTKCRILGEESISCSTPQRTAWLNHTC